MKRSPTSILAVASIVIPLYLAPLPVMAQFAVFNDPIDFVTATGAVVVPIPSAATAFPSGFDCGYAGSRRGGSVTIPFDSNSVQIVNEAQATMCIYDSGVVSGPDTNPNVMIANTILISGEDDYLLTFVTPVNGVGFRLLTNACAKEIITLRDAANTLILSQNIDSLTAPNSRQFVGFQSSVPIKSVLIDTCGGAVQNEGIDALMVAGPVVTMPLALEQGTFVLDARANRDRVTLQGWFSAPPNGIDPSTDGIAIDLRGPAGTMLALTIGGGAGWQTGKGPQWTFRDAPDGSAGGSSARETVRIAFDRGKGVFRFWITVDGFDVENAGEGEIVTSLRIGAIEFKGSRDWRLTGKGRQLITP